MSLVENSTVGARIQKQLNKLVKSKFDEIRIINFDFRLVRGMGKSLAALGSA